MKVTGAWVREEATQAVFRALASQGHRAYFVGGCVRNDLLGQPVADIDISTDAHPQDVIDAAEKAGLHAVPTGIEHGTITVVSDHVPHEITTFRKDVETDGRRAVVAFAETMAEDALRRDFTINALYATAQGDIVDPLGGLKDIETRRLRFIEDPEQRIREDYLRIMRFFRFYAFYGDPLEGPDAEGLAACAALSEGLDGISKERISQEMRKLLGAPDPAPAMAAMRSTGVLARILPGADDALLGVLVHLDHGHDTKPIRRLAILGGEDVADHLRLSRAEARDLEVLKDHSVSTLPAVELGYRLGAALARDVVLLRAAFANSAVSETDLSEIDRGATTPFPVKAGDLMPGFTGPALGEKLRELEADWLASDLRKTREELLG